MATQVFEHGDSGVTSRAAQQVWLRSVPARISAVGFIILIVMGNFWLIEALWGGQGQAWVRTGLQLGTATVLVGAISLLIRAIIAMFR